MELTSLILITYEISPGVKVSIVTVGNYSSTGSRYPSTKNIISVSTPPVYFPNRSPLGVISPVRRFYVSLSCTLMNDVSQRLIPPSQHADNKPHSIFLAENPALE